jgi:hypothetical protein
MTAPLTRRSLLKLSGEALNPAASCGSVSGMSISLARAVTPATAQRTD